MTAAYDIDRDWRADALCARVDPELFFPTAEDGPLYEAQVVAAKRVCAGCPVWRRCLDYALAALPDGIAGGLTPDERARLRRRGGLDNPTAARAARVGVGEGSPAATGTPLRIFAAREALAGNKSPEGNRG
ncbi:WhiB family transcriptional regulator [Pseudonocardia sp.]|uniref:WhiB family transcriptional regulator n=1 Tax=Pseudonocardia sp. TaxID=60912 RepID=UPI003D0EDBBF